jgi:hypothetical protein
MRDKRKPSELRNRSRKKVESCEEKLKEIELAENLKKF